MQEPVFRVLNSEHLYKSLLAELPRENSSWGLSFQVSVLPLAPPGSWVPRTVLSSCRPSSELWPALGQTEGGRAGQTAEGERVVFLSASFLPCSPTGLPALLQKLQVPEKQPPVWPLPRLPALSTPGVWKLQALSKQSSFVNQSSGLGLKP